MPTFNHFDVVSCHARKAKTCFLYPHCFCFMLMGVRHRRSRQKSKGWGQPHYNQNDHVYDTLDKVGCFMYAQWCCEKVGWVSGTLRTTTKVNLNDNWVNLKVIISWQPNYKHNYHVSLAFLSRWATHVSLCLNWGGGRQFKSNLKV